MRSILAGLLFTATLSAGPLVPEDNSVVLLITSPELAPAWKPFADWKASNGITNKLSTGRALMAATKASMAKDAKQSAEFHLCLAESNLLGDPHSRRPPGQEVAPR